MTMDAEMPRTARDPGTEARVAVAPAHLVHFYEEEETLAGAIARFVMDGLSAGEIITTVATGEHTRAIDRQLRARGSDPDAIRVQEIARAHGGTVEVSSSAGEGTTFLVHLPRRASHVPIPVPLLRA